MSSFRNSTGWVLWKGMAMKRLAAIGLLAALGVISLLIAACGGAQAEADRIDAAQAGAIEMGIDPETTGNTASTLGPQESCVRVDVPSPSFDGVSDYNIDVYVKGDTQPPTAYDASVVYTAFNDGCPAEGEAETGGMCLNSQDDDGDGQVNDGCPQVGPSAESGAQCDPGDQGDDDGDVLVHVAAPGTDALVKMPGAFDMSDSPLPDNNGVFHAGAIHFSGMGGTPGDGTIIRLGLDIGGSGVATFTLNPSPLSAYNSAVAPSGHPVNVYPAGARLAINQDCPAVTPTATPAATPTSTSTPGTPTPTPPPGTTVLVSGWNYSCYVGPGQPFEEALGDVADKVMAVYQMRTDGRFDRWFPGKPDFSTVAAVSPYQPLFILMADGASWAQQSSGTPPASVPLMSGWNSVCYTGQTKSAGDAAAGVAGGFAVMYRLASDQNWSRYVPGNSGLSDLVELSQFDAVLMLVNQAGGTNWTFAP